METLHDIACKTAVIFAYFRGTGPKASRARSASCVRGEDFLANFASHATRASRSPRTCLALAPVPLKCAKNHSCSAGHHDLTCHATAHRHMKTADACQYANAEISEI